MPDEQTWTLGADDVTDEVVEDEVSDTSVEDADDVSGEDEVSGESEEASETDASELVRRALEQIVKGGVIQQAPVVEEKPAPAPVAAPSVSDAVLDSIVKEFDADEPTMRAVKKLLDAVLPSVVQTQVAPLAAGRREQVVREHLAAIGMDKSVNASDVVAMMDSDGVEDARFFDPSIPASEKQRYVQQTTDALIGRMLREGKLVAQQSGVEVPPPKKNPQSVIRSSSAGGKGSVVNAKEREDIAAVMKAWGFDEEDARKLVRSVNGGK